MRERLQKILASAGLASRRGAEDIIRRGQVTVNGKVASLGDSADPDTDKITVAGKRLGNMPKKTYVALNKPRGYVTSLRDELGRKQVDELLTGIHARLFPVGRLDMDSEGLLLMTNDGEWANLIAHPSHMVEKTYLVTVIGDVVAASRQISKGIDIMAEDGTVDYHVQPLRVAVQDQSDEGGRMAITITEGHNREIRRICEQCNLKVKRLIRTSIGPVMLQGIKTGEYRFLSQEEIRSLTKSGNREKRK